VKYDASFPLVREADEEIVKTKAAIEKAREINYADQVTDLNPTYQLIQQDMARTRLDLATQRANSTAIANSVRTMDAQMVDLDGKSVKQTGLLREAKADEANYLLYVGKREQERTDDALDQRRIADVAIAVALQVTFGGLILAMLAGISAAYVAEFMDSTFRTPAQVTEALNIPVLATLPRQAA
jgi:uncharacterized protein involved in exopolysaccharide biosynthesis